MAKYTDLYLKKFPRRKKSSLDSTRIRMSTALSKYIFQSKEFYLLVHSTYLYIHVQYIYLIMYK